MKLPNLKHNIKIVVSEIVYFCETRNLGHRILFISQIYLSKCRFFFIIKKMDLFLYNKNKNNLENVKIYMEIVC